MPKKRKMRPSEAGSSAENGLSREDLDLWASEDAFAGIGVSPMKHDPSLSKVHNLARTPERRRRPERGFGGSTPSTASPQRVMMMRSPLLDAAKMMNVFGSPNAKHIGDLATPLKHGHSPIPISVGFSSPFADFVRDLSPLRQNSGGMTPAGGNVGESTPLNPFEQSPLNVLSTLGSAVKDGTVILRSEMNDTAVGAEPQTKRQKHGKRKNTRKKKSSKAKKSKNKAVKAKKDTRGTKRGRGSRDNEEGGTSVSDSTASSGTKKSYWKRLELTSQQISKAKSAGAEAKSGKSTDGAFGGTPRRNGKRSHRRAYTSPRPELQFSSSRISLASQSPKFLRSPTSYTIKLGIAHSPCHLSRSVRTVNSMVRARQAASDFEFGSVVSSSSSSSEARAKLSAQSSTIRSVGGESLKKKGSKKAKSKTSSPTSKKERKPCNCKKSKCLKLYCECFAARLYCDKCNCLSCENSKNHEKSRAAAIKAVLDRNPKAFDAKIKGKSGDTKKHTKGCHCKKSGCKKKYCECFQAGIACSDKCKCANCENTPADRGECGGIVMKLMKDPLRRHQQVFANTSSKYVDLSVSAASQLSVFDHGAIDFIDTVRNSRNSKHSAEDIRQALISDSPLAWSLPILDRGKEEGMSSCVGMGPLWDPRGFSKIEFNFDELSRGSLRSVDSFSSVSKDRKVIEPTYLEKRDTYFGTSNRTMPKDIVSKITLFLANMDLAPLAAVSRKMCDAVTIPIRERQIRLEWNSCPSACVGKIRPSILGSSAAVAAVRAEVAGKGSSSLLFQKMASSFDQPQIASFMGPLKAQLGNGAKSSPPSTPSASGTRRLASVVSSNPSTPIIPAIANN